MKQKELNIPVKKDKTPTRKKAYEKPRLETVMLFADQVMATCRAPLPSTCPVPDPSRS